MGELREEACRQKCVTSLGEKLSVEGNCAEGASPAALGVVRSDGAARCFVECALIVCSFRSNERAPAKEREK